MKKNTSFISEHTAEYVLVENLKEILETQYRYVVPLFPWITREGSRLSRKIHSNDEFKVLGFYSRRPKIVEPDTAITFTINEELFAAASVAEELKIPMFIGCPIVRNFWELSKPQCIWLKLNDQTESIYKFNFQMETTTDSQTNILSPKEILDEISAHSQIYNVTTFIDALRFLRQNSSASFFTFGGYKPVYFLLKY